MDADHAKLLRAARDFEAILLHSLLEQFQTGLGEGEQSDPAASTLKSLGLQAVAVAMASSGGLGIARLLVQQLTPKAAEVFQVGKKVQEFLETPKAPSAPADR